MGMESIINLKKLSAKTARFGASVFAGRAYQHYPEHSKGN